MQGVVHRLNGGTHKSVPLFNLPMTDDNRLEGKTNEKRAQTPFGSQHGLNCKQRRCTWPTLSQLQPTHQLPHLNNTFCSWGLDMRGMSSLETRVWVEEDISTRHNELDILGVSPSGFHRRRYPVGSKHYPGVISTEETTIIDTETADRDQSREGYSPD
ncbi:hypothetical protein AAG570_007511 [Ranatra chinensis]|uniref:Uncharacterized protein n=1 Tax=Ranatra chinensis TaxID=642074 RepID=A0ABD0XW45_9HEMI